MKEKTTILAIIGLSAALAAVAPNAPFLRLLDRVFAAAAQGSARGASALGVLESVAEARLDNISVESERVLGFNPGQLHNEWFKDSAVRAYALRKIGEVDLPEALNFLDGLKRGDLGPDPSGQLWPASQIALVVARMNRIATPSSKIEFLENALASRNPSTPSSWIAGKLCDLGALTAMPEIRLTIRRNEGDGRRAEDEIAFCEARVRTVMRDSNRSKALGWVLGTDIGESEARLVGWAIHELDSMHSPEADAELDRFASEIRNLPKEAPRFSRLWEFQAAIEGIQKDRNQRDRVR